MNSDMTHRFGAERQGSKHPAASTIEDVITFQLQVLVSIGERAGQDWSERMFGISLNEWRVLGLVKSRAPCRASDLAELLLMDKSQTSRVIKVLQKKDLLRTLPDPDDGRAIALRLSTEGEALYERVFDEVMGSNERILSVLSPEEVVAFQNTLKKLISHSKDLLELRLGRKLVR